MKAAAAGQAGAQSFSRARSRPRSSASVEPSKRRGSESQRGSPAAMEEKKRAAAKVVTTLFPRIPKVTTLLLEFYIKREDTIVLTREPLSHFCQEEVVLAAQDILDKLHRQVITFQDVRDTAENLIGKVTPT
ncbi:hypothetical protein HPB50_014415 [Hyalomma asiaticum]|uniref:Uncharacterized protein n=1 Tax=Hyalomma asiaticum TaxID=266040 RepID=A0ACB7RIR3_HYAAI|nr:hypothetical protein HPB50_014415 [Hyalomma asiaticum]